MALRIIKTTETKYKPIQDAGTWINNAMYIVRTEIGLNNIYIHGELCGSYNDEDLKEAIDAIKSELSQFQALSNLELESLLQ